MIDRLVKIVIFFSAFVMLTLSEANGQNDDYFYSVGGRTDIKIYFTYDQAYIDSTYMGNQKMLRLVDYIVNDNLYLSTVDKIEIVAQSSPEGSIAYNKRLSERRIKVLEEYFASKYPQVDSKLWSFSSVAENWGAFRDDLAGDSAIPNHKKVLSIADSSRDADSKEWLLKTLDDGRSWSYIKEYILPKHRYGASMMFVPTAHTPLPQPITYQIDNRVVPIMSDCSPLPSVSNSYARAAAAKSTKLVALKTNMLLDVASVVNLAVEVPIGNRWSVVGEVVYPWWRSWPANFTMQIESYHGEVKYWLGERTKDNQLRGWSVGAYGGWGLYDIQPFSEIGVQGDFFDVGAQVAYSHPIARNLHLEYTLGFGYLSTDYNDYYMAYDTEEFGDIKVIPYPWMNAKLRSVLPTRLGVSLVWHIKSKWRGGKR